MKLLEIAVIPARRWWSVTLAVVAALCLGGAAGARNERTTVLAPGQGVTVSGTDMVCAFGGPADQIGLACLHTSSAAKSAYSFRVQETTLRVFRRTGATTAQLRAWKEPAAGMKQRRSATIAHFKSVGAVSIGSRFTAARSDLSCSVYSFKGTINVACFKLSAKGTMDGSYAVALGGATVQVSRFQGGHGTTVFIGR